MRNTPSLDNFPLAWRWTSTAHAVLSLETLALIEPLAPDEASDIAAEALRRCTIESNAQEFAADEQADATLRALPIPDEATVLISWSAETAVRTRWRVFREHWDDFCYAASDDVSIWAPGSEWSLCYFHYEVFILKRG